MVNTYQIQEAKQRFSAVAEQAAKGHPQLVTKHGRPFVVLLGAKEWEDLQGPSKGVLEALRACPADLNELKITRGKDVPRSVKL
jgi:prevent-host-death family protein